MEFQKLLLQIGQSLGPEEVKALAFLCTDLSLQSLNSVELFSDLCSSLSDQDLLSPERPQLLAELLLTIQRPRLARGLNLTNQGPKRDHISAYRKLLYDLSEDITDEDLRNVKFLLNQRLPRRKLDENVTTLELFLEMEHMDLLSETNLNLLQSIFESVCPMLNTKISCYKEQATYVSSEEMNLSSSVSYIVDHNQHTLHENPQSYIGVSTVSGLESRPEPLMNPSNASGDFPQEISSPNYSGVLSQQVSELNIGTNYSSVKETCGTLKMSPESTGMFEKPSATLNIYTAATNDEVLGSYPMTGAKRGICLIINNYNFSNLKMREGTNIDQESLKKVFQWLDFKVEVHHDCTKDKMLSVVKELSSRNHNNMDCMVCCILSHGLEGEVYGVDGQTVSIRNLTQLFNGSQCPSLADKPKLFFIQACQGLLEQQAVTIQTDGPTPCFVENDAVATQESIPSDADFLLGMATIPSFASYRERSSGSWFIQALCKNLVQMVPRGLDLVSVLTKVNADVSQKTGFTSDGTKKQMPQPAFSLRKKVIFPVPPTPPPELP